MGRLTDARRAARAIVAVGVLAAAMAGAAPVAADHVAVHFGEPAAEATWGRGIELAQPVEIRDEVARIELLIARPGDNGPFVVEIPPPYDTGPTTLVQFIDTEAGGHLLPNTSFTARWVVTLAGPGGESVTGPEVRVTYRDTERDWRTREGDIIRVHWYEGPDSFGERALQIGEEAIAETSALLGVTETEPIDFFIYADEAEFREVLGPGTRENVGGQANAEIRTLFGLIQPSEIGDAWVNTVIPHELVHLVFDTAVRNPYHFPPRWLNEGIAVYLTEGYDTADRRLVERAVDDGGLIPLDGLTGQFPTTRDGFLLAYAESVSAVDFLVRVHGRDALVNLVRSYAEGVTDDEAFDRATGLTVAEFDAAWRADLGAREPTAHGPQPGPAGPLPPGWAADPAAPGGSPPATSPPGAATADPGDPSREPAGAPIGGGADGGLPVGGLLAIGGLALVLVGGAVWLRGRRVPAAAHSSGIDPAPARNPEPAPALPYPPPPPPPPPPSRASREPDPGPRPPES